MNVWAWILIGWMVAEALTGVAMIGKHRPPITPFVAICMIFLWAGMAFLLVLAVTS